MRQDFYGDYIVNYIIPILYYVALFIQADLEAAKNGIERVPGDQIPRLKAVLKDGWIFIVPFAALIYALFWLNWRAKAARQGMSIDTVGHLVVEAIRSNDPYIFTHPEFRTEIEARHRALMDAHDAAAARLAGI